MNKPETYSFKNSEACQGVGAVSGQDISHDVIDISGRYPEDGFWARNLEAKETVIVARGLGSLAIREVGVVELDASDDQNRAVTIEPRQWFAWDGDMTISMVCEPPFDSAKYEVVSSSSVEQLASLDSLVKEYFPEDAEFIEGLDFNDAIGFIYGQLLNDDIDPDEVLKEFGITEGENYEV